MLSEGVYERYAFVCVSVCVCVRAGGFYLCLSLWGGGVLPNSEYRGGGSRALAVPRLPTGAAVLSEGVYERYGVCVCVWGVCV